MAREQVERLRREGRVGAIVLDVPLLVESGWNTLCDKLIFVDAPREARLRRAAQRGWSAEEIDRREALQQSLESKRQQADYTIDNSGSLESLQEQVDRIWAKLVGSPE